MRILICASSAPLPPLNGFRLLVDALWRELRRDHEVRVLAFRLPDQDGAVSSDPDLRLVRMRKPGPLEQGRALTGATLRRQPLDANRVAASLRDPLREELARFRPDVVHVTAGRLAGLAAELTGRPSVLAALDARHLNVQARLALASGPRRALLRRELQRVKRYESTQYRRFGHVVVVSTADRDALLEQDPALRITVIPNGVDTARFAPRPDAIVDPSRLVFTGGMGYPPNVDAAEFLAREVLPRVRSSRPDARLVVVGREPSPRVRALSQLDGVSVTGEVPELQPWLVGSRVYVCPMRTGTGIKNKLLEAMACGVPCVATPLAIQGLECAHERHLLVAETAEELAVQVVRVLDDDALAQRLGEAARSYVVERHAWAAVARAYERVQRSVRTGAQRQEPEPPSVKLPPSTGRNSNS